MNSCTSKASVILVASISIIAVAYFFYSRFSPLPIYEPSQVNPELVDEEVRRLKNHRVAFFSLLDQKSQVTDSSFLKGNIHVADFFFTTCKTICPRMSASMETVSSQFLPEDNVRFLSFSVLPEEDSVSVLREYAVGYNVNYDQWRLLTGDKKVIYDLARKSYFTLKPTEVGKGDGSSDDFIHTNNFVLVDSQRRIRGYYDGTSVLDMKRLVKDIENLRVEEERSQSQVNP